MTLDKVQDTLARYRDDPIMLDAFWQWVNGGFRRAVQGKHTRAEERAYRCFLDNLRLRYGLSPAEAEAVGAKLEQDCSALVEGVTFDVKKAVVEALSGELGEPLRQDIQRKVGEASLTAQCLLALFHWLGGLPDHSYTVSLSAWSGPLEALLRATLGGLPGSQVKPFQAARDELIACGVFNKSFYESGSGKTSYEEYLPGLFVPHVSLASVAPPPDGNVIATYLDALCARQAFEQARVLEEVALGGVVTMYYSHGEGELPGAVVPCRGLFAYVDVQRYKVHAVNPLARDLLLKHILELKAQRLSGLAANFRVVLGRLRDEVWPKGDLACLKDEPDRKVWRLDQIGVSRLFIYCGNWLSRSDLASLCNLGAAPLGDDFLVILTDQSLPSVERVVANSLVMWQKSSSTVLVVGENAVTSHQLRGEQHPSTPRILFQFAIKMTL